MRWAINGGMSKGDGLGTGAGGKGGKKGDSGKSGKGKPGGDEAPPCKWLRYEECSDKFGTRAVVDFAAAGNQHNPRHADVVDQLRGLPEVLKRGKCVKLIRFELADLELRDTIFEELQEPIQHVQRNLGVMLDTLNFTNNMLTDNGVHSLLKIWLVPQMEWLETKNVTPPFPRFVSLAGNKISGVGCSELKTTGERFYNSLKWFSTEFPVTPIAPQSHPGEEPKAAAGVSPPIAILSRWLNRSPQAPKPRFRNVLPAQCVREREGKVVVDVTNTFQSRPQFEGLLREISGMLADKPDTFIFCAPNNATAETAHDFVEAVVAFLDYARESRYAIAEEVNLSGNHLRDEETRMLAEWLRRQLEDCHKRSSYYPAKLSLADNDLTALSGTLLMHEYTNAMDSTTVPFILELDRNLIKPSLVQNTKVCDMEEDGCDQYLCNRGAMFHLPMVFLQRCEARPFGADVHVVIVDGEAFKRLIPLLKVPRSEAVWQSFASQARFAVPCSTLNQINGANPQYKEETLSILCLCVRHGFFFCPNTPVQEEGNFASEALALLQACKLQTHNNFVIASNSRDPSISVFPRFSPCDLYEKLAPIMLNSEPKDTLRAVLKVEPPPVREPSPPPPAPPLSRSELFKELLALHVDLLSDEEVKLSDEDRSKCAAYALRLHLEVTCATGKGVHAGCTTGQERPANGRPYPACEQ
ncbi:hypothetical protein DIPPA_12953 [Diplonema papillatum]|nr:hypothetical protein DIPPA_12953 [Diplonema papillatum]